MSDEEAAEKLRSRLNQWQSYVAQSSPVPSPAPVAPDDLRATPGNPPAAPLPVRPDEPAPPSNGARAPSEIFVPELVDDAPAAEPVDPVLARAEAHIHDLREAVEHERDRAAQLAETVTREQVLRAASLRLEAEQQRPAAPKPAAPGPVLPLRTAEDYQRQARARDSRFTAALVVVSVVVFALILWLLK